MDYFSPSNFLNRVLLKPHSNSLLTQGGSFWIFGARLLILIMALTEGFIWGYLGSFFGEESFGTYGAIITGVFMFLLIWVVDATFITLDTSRAFYERKLSGNPEFNLKTETAKLVGGIAARLLIVTLSLTISAPYLAQMVLENDISNKIIQENNSLIAKQRTIISKPYDEKMKDLKLEWSITQKERVLEAAGKGVSGQYGRGDALKTIELKLEDLNREIKKIELDKISALNQYDSLSINEKASLYDININKDGLKTRNRIVDGFKSDASFISANYAVKAFLVFLFCGLLVLKIFQPRSIKIYYNEQLQDLFQQYKLGFFDSWIEQHELPISGKLMTPMRFEDWCINTYSIVKQEDENNRYYLTVKNEYAKKFEVLTLLLTVSQEELDPLLDQKAIALENIQVLINKENELLNLINRKQKEFAEMKENVEKIENNINSNTINGKELGKVLEIKNSLIEELKSEDKVIIELKNQEFDTKSNLKKNTTSRDMLTKLIESKKEEILKYQNEIVSLRDNLVGRTLSQNINKVE